MKGVRDIDKGQLMDALPVALPRPGKRDGAALEDDDDGGGNEVSDAKGGHGVYATSPALGGGFFGE